MFDYEAFVTAFAVLFVIIDPPGCAAIFAMLTTGTTRKHQYTMALKSVVIAAVLLVGFALFSEFIFEKFGISLDALRIAGGIMLFVIGLNMVFEKRTESREERAEETLQTVEDPEDISVFPIGIPMVAGPGTMTSLMIMMGDENTELAQQTAILTALAAVLILTWLSFLVSGPLVKLMGKSVTDVLTRVLGILLTTLATQFVIDGVKGALL